MLLLVGHAPQSSHPAVVVCAWWRALGLAVDASRLPAEHLVAMLGINGRAESSTSPFIGPHGESPENAGGGFFHEFAAAQLIFALVTFGESTEDEDFWTWRSSTN